MKTDKTYSYIEVCPKTQIQVNTENSNGGVCPHCGHLNSSSWSHSEKIPGRFNRPSFKERWFEGKKLEFIRKEDEDKIMERLSE